MLTHRTGGFTLIELLAAMAVLALLTSLAAPSWLQQVRKVRRADAHAALAQVQLAQERLRSQQPTYTATLGAGGLELSDLSPAGHYRLTISTPPEREGTDHLALAQALGPQADDAECRYLALGSSAGVRVQQSGATDALTNDTAANRRCWGR
jgi:type IV pilus assembly protein PilE